MRDELHDRTESAESAEADELALLAIEDAFVAEHRAGHDPRLATYLAHFPEHAAALTDFVADFLVEEAPEPSEVATNPNEHALSVGTLRALAALFPQPASERRLAVAEARTAYTTSPVDLPALAREQDVSLDTLASVLALPVAALARLTVDACSAPQLAALAQALGLSPDEVSRRLSR